MAIVTPADRPKSVRNRCVIEVFGGVLYVVTLLFGFSVGVRASVIGLSQISSFSLSMSIEKPFSIAGADESSLRCYVSGDDHIGYSYDCSRIGFTSVPTDFNANTKSIDLSSNRISNIPENAFRNYSRLNTLTISRNPLTLDSEDLHGMFTSLVSIQSLSIDNILKTKDFTKLTSVLCKNLQHLTFLSIDVVDHFNFSEHCQDMKNLKTLILHPVEPIKLHNNSLDVLEGLHIEEFQLSGGTVYKPLEIDFLQPLSHLNILHVEGTESITISYLLETILYPLRNRVDPIDLFFRGLEGFDEIQKLTAKQLRYIKNLCVKRLILRDTYIQSIDYITLSQSRLWYCLEELDLSYNYNLRFVDIMVFSLSAPNIHVVNMCCQLSRQGTVPNTFNPRHSYNEIHNENSNFTELEIYLPDHLTSFSVSDNDLQALVYHINLVVHANGITELFLRDLFIQDCLGTFKGFQNLEILQITKWNCGRINPNFIANITSVRELTFSSVNIGENAKTMTFFTRWVHLEFLDISQNFITDLHPDFF